MSWAGWYILCTPLVLLAILVAWTKYTEYQIDKQYRDRQDDE